MTGRVRSKQKKLTPIDYLRLGRAIGKIGYCGECCGCLVYRDFCDWAMELRDAEAEANTHKRHRPSTTT